MEKFVSLQSLAPSSVNRPSGKIVMCINVAMDDPFFLTSHWHVYLGTRPSWLGAEVARIKMTGSLKVS